MNLQNSCLELLNLSASFRFFWVSNLNFQWIFGFTLEMNGLVLEIAFEYDKAIQIQRLWNSIRMSSAIRNNIIHLRNSWHYKTRFWISFLQKHFGCQDDEVTRFFRIQFQLIGLNCLSLHLNLSTEVRAVQCISSCWQMFWTFSNEISVHCCSELVKTYFLFCNKYFVTSFLLLVVDTLLASDIWLLLFKMGNHLMRHASTLLLATL